MDVPFFSIVMPAFNRAGVIRRALDSVYSQDFASYEVIVVDDGSTDDTEVVVRPYLERGLLYLRNEQNCGVGITRNRGVRRTRGHWVAFLDTDNYLLPGALATIRAAAVQADRSIAVLLGRAVDSDGRPALRDPSLSGRIGFADYVLRIAGEALPIARREVLLQFPFDETLGTKRECGSLVWWAIAKAGHDYLLVDQVVECYDSKQPDRLSAKPFISRFANEMVICNSKTLQLFGADLLHLSPAAYVSLVQKTAFYSIMARRRRCALHYAWTAWKTQPLSLRTPALFVLLLLGSRVARRIYEEIP